MFVSKTKSKKGFTLVELLVTISIFVILTGVVLFSQAKFNSSILLTNLAYDTALTIRQAQTYGINIKNFNNTGLAINDKFVPYGVHFDTTYPKSFILFADLDSNGTFDGTADKCLSSYGVGTQDGCVNRYNIKNSNYIDTLQAKVGGIDVPVTKIDMVFKRPNPDALFSDGSNRVITDVTINLKGSDGSPRSVKVSSLGLIEVSH